MISQKKILVLTSILIGFLPAVAFSSQENIEENLVEMLKSEYGFTISNKALAKSVVSQVLQENQVLIPLIEKSSHSPSEISEVDIKRVFEMTAETTAFFLDKLFELEKTKASKEEKESLVKALQLDLVSVSILLSIEKASVEARNKSNLIFPTHSTQVSRLFRYAIFTMLSAYLTSKGVASSLRFESPEFVGGVVIGLSSPAHFYFWNRFEKLREQNQQNVSSFSRFIDVLAATFALPQIAADVMTAQIFNFSVVENENVKNSYFNFFSFKNSVSQRLEEAPVESVNFLDKLFKSSSKDLNQTEFEEKFSELIQKNCNQYF
jgi:hypothetical protein